MRALLLALLLSCAPTNPRPNMCAIDTIDDADACAKSKVWACQTDRQGNIEWCALLHQDPFTLEPQT